MMVSPRRRPAQLGRNLLRRLRRNKAIDAAQALLASGNSLQARADFFYVFRMRFCNVVRFSPDGLPLVRHLYAARLVILHACIASRSRPNRKAADPFSWLTRMQSPQ